MRSLGRERLPARAGEQALERAIRELGVRDGRHPLQVAAAELLEPRVDLGVHARDEEARDGREPVDRLACSDAPLEAVDPGVRDLLVALDREQQRDVDREARRGQLAERIDALRRRRHLDEHVRAVDLVADALGGLDRAGGVARELGRQLERDVAVLAVGVVVARAQQLGAVADVLVGERKKIPRASRPSRAAALSPRSYRSEWPMAFSKMVGFEVTPLMPSWAIRLASLPDSSSSRLMLSSQIDWPSARIASSGLPMLWLSLVEGRLHRTQQCGPERRTLPNMSDLASRRERVRERRPRRRGRRPRSVPPVAALV